MLKRPGVARGGPLERGLVESWLLWYRLLVGGCEESRGWDSMGGSRI